MKGGETVQQEVQQAIAFSNSVIKIKESNTGHVYPICFLGGCPRTGSVEKIIGVLLGVVNSRAIQRFNKLRL